MEEPNVESNPTLPAMPLEPEDGTSDGVRTVTLRSWRDFVELMTGTEMLRPGLIWRGQRKGDRPDWGLRPRLDRDFTPTILFPPDDPLGQQAQANRQQWQARYETQLARFKRAVAGRRGVNPRNLSDTKREGNQDENDEWWALGQHYGLHTPFLDWTESPFAALFFAYAEDTEEGRTQESTDVRYRFVFALDRTAIDKRNDELDESADWQDQHMPIRLRDHDPTNPTSVARALAERERRRIERRSLPGRLRIIHPTTDENLRLLSQGGMFTQAPPGEDVEEFVRGHFRRTRENAILLDGKAPDDEPIWMFKFRIAEGDDRARRDCLSLLNRMAINYRILLPDLVGASQFVNMSLADPSY
jgi:FRG domain